MSEDTSMTAQSQSREKWNQARRHAFYQRLSSALGLTRQPVSLLSFEEVQQKLRLTQSAYRGLQQVPLSQIVGSVGRYHDFTRTFLPLVEGDGQRWRRVAELQFDSGLPPIELYKVGEAYFVKDGNHRVSVARQFGMQTIEAYVWEYQTPVGGVSAEAELSELIVKAEYRAFLDHTELDITQPDQNIILTEPGMYPELELEIELYRENLERIDGEPRSYRDAASAWYDMIYTTAIEIIKESGVLDQFPGRTEADLYVWVSRHRKELAERYGGQISLRDAVAQIAETHHRPGPVERVMQSAARSVAGFFQSLAHDRAESEELVVPPNPDEPLGKLLAEVNGWVPSMAYRGQRGDEWRQWRQSLRDRLRELIGLDYVPAGHVHVEQVDSSVVSGVERIAIRLTAADGLVLPGYVLRPADVDGRLPALLVYPGHGTIRQVAGLEAGRNQVDGLVLAQAGYLVLTLEERGFGELGKVDHVALDNIARLIGRTWLATAIGDGLRGLDYLQERPDVKPEHLGVIGHGAGAGLALYSAALDERIRATVIDNYVGGGIDPLEVLGHGCDFVPSLRRYVELSDVARLIAPRPLMFVYPLRRPSTRAARAMFDKMRPTYEAFSCPDRTRFLEEEDRDRNMVAARNWFARWLIEEEDTSVLLWAARE